MKWYTILKIRIIKLFIVPCEKATFYLTKKQYGSLTFGEKVKLDMHLMKCKYCRYFLDEQLLLSKSFESLDNNIEHHVFNFELTDEQRIKLNDVIRTELSR